MRLVQFTYHAAVLGALVLIVLLQLALLRIQRATYELVKIEALILLQESAAVPPAPAPRDDNQVASR